MDDTTSPMPTSCGDPSKITLACDLATNNFKMVELISSVLYLSYHITDVVAKSLFPGIQIKMATQSKDIIMECRK
jgi:hypothetical protein